MSLRLTVIALLVLPVSACGHGQKLQSQSPSAGSTENGGDTAAITSAIEQHLRSNSAVNMSAMDMTVGQVTVNGDQAQASAEFRSKQGGPSMLMTYFLQRQSDGWVVTRSRPSGGQYSHPPMDSTHSGANPNSPSSAMPQMPDFVKAPPPPQKD